MQFCNFHFRCISQVYNLKKDQQCTSVYKCKLYEVYINLYVTYN
jgi:hypothetical protein